MQVLVTGVSGFSGSFVARALASAGHDVTGLFRRETNFLAQARKQANIRLEQAGLDSVGGLAGPFEAIVHTAATSPAPGITDAMIVRDNLDGTTALLAEAGRWGTERFVFFSSLSLYGDVTAPLLDEETAIVNPDIYGASKRQCELLVSGSGIPSLSLRLPGVLGPGAHRNWLSGIATKLKARKTIRAFHLDSPFNNAVHIDDIARLVSTVLAHSWTDFDAVVLGARGALPVRRVIESLAQGLGVTAQIEPAPATKSSFILSSHRAIARWGYDPMEIGEMAERYGREIRLS